MEQQAVARPRGFLDAVVHRVIHGWAQDPQRPHERQLVWVEINGALRGAARADRPRPDLRAAGIGDGGHGFSFPVPDDVDEVRTVAARVERTPLPPAEGFRIDPQTNAPPSDGWAPGPGCRHPSFFLLGAAKCGTTSLHDHLGQHPDVCMSEPKEPFFFEAEQALGAGWYRNRYFSHWRDEPIVGDARHRNLYLPWVADEIAAHAPGARFVAIVRDPVERLISHWWHWRSRGLEPLSLEEAVADDLARIESGLRYETVAERELYRAVLEEDGRGTYRSYVDSGYYASQLRRYVERFGADRLLVLRFEQLTADPRAAVERVLRFLGADPGAAAGIDTPHLTRGRPRPADVVEPELVRRLRDHYAPHERALERLLAELDAARAAQTRRST